MAEETKAIAGKEAVGSTSIDIRDRKAIKGALEATIQQFGGIDILINTAAIFPSRITTVPFSITGPASV